MPMPGSAAPNSLPDYFQSVLDRLILAPPNGDGLACDGTAEAPRASDDLFALCLGSQWLDRWSGANACVIVPAGGVGGNQLKTLQGNKERPVLFSLRWSIEIHVWGREAPENVTGRARDVQRYKEAFQIFENVSRVLYVLASGYGEWVDLTGFNNDTPVNKYGEEIVATFSVPVPIYDYQRTHIPLPQQLKPAAGNPVVEGGGSA